MVLPFQQADLQIAPLTGVGGAIEIDTRLFRVTWDNQIIEEMTRYVTAWTVSHDQTRAASNWVLDCTMSYDGWKRLSAFEDWLAVWQTVEYAGQQQITRQLGHYIVLDAPESWTELGGIVRLDCRDPLWVLAAHGISFAVDGPAQAPRLAKVRDVINRATVPGAPEGSKLRHTIATYTGEPSEWLGPWNEDMRRLTLSNQILTTGYYYPLYTDGSGVVHTASQRAQSSIPAIATLFANVPESVITDLTLTAPEREALGSLVGRDGNVAGADIQTRPFTEDIVDEVIVRGDVVNGVVGRADRRKFVITGKAAVYDPSIARQETVDLPSVKSQAIADALAERLLEQYLTRNTEVTLYALPNPALVALHGVIKLAIWTTRGDVIAQGNYAVRRIKYGLTAEDALMQIDCSYIEDVTAISQASPLPVTP